MFMSGPSLLASCNHTLVLCDETKLWNAHPPACLYPGPTCSDFLFASTLCPSTVVLLFSGASIYPRYRVSSTSGATPSRSWA